MYRIAYIQVWVIRSYAIQKICQNACQRLMMPRSVVTFLQVHCLNFKQFLTIPPTLAPPDYSKPFLLQTDASYRGIGAVLSQEHDQEEKPVAFFSRKLLDREIIMTPQKRKV